MSRACVVLCLLFAACNTTEPKQPVPPAGSPVADALFARALEDDRAMAILRDLCTAAPKRLSGSQGAADAVAWSLQTMRQLGLVNVRAEPCMVPHWQRGIETAALVAPRPQPLRVCALGGSIATPAGGIEAEVVEVRSFEQLHELGEQARGKIVFFNRPMPRALRRTGPAYGQTVPQRGNGAIEAGKVGAVAALVRSVTTSIDEFPHTGAMNYDAAVPKVPAAAVCTADAELIAALLQKGPVRLRLELGCQTLPDVESANVVGELRGDSLPDEVVVIGGHLDAWDLGLGAHDDGAGCAHVLEAMRLLQTSGLHHKRTIRAVLFMNEENGLRGGEAYAQAHAAEKHVAALETDGGGAAPEGIGCSLRDAAAAPIRAAMAPLAAHDAGTFLEGGGGGADIGPLAKQGVPMFSLIVNDARYFDYHHSAQDIPAAVNGRELALGAATVAFAALMLADQ